MIPTSPSLPPTTPSFFFVPYKRASIHGSTLLHHQFSLIFTVIFNIRVVPLYTEASNIHPIQEHQTHFIQAYQTYSLYRSIKHTFYTGASNIHYIQEHQTYILYRSIRHYIKEHQTDILYRSIKHTLILSTHARTHNGPAKWSCQTALCAIAIFYYDFTIKPEKPSYVLFLIIGGTDRRGWLLHLPSKGVGWGRGPPSLHLLLGDGRVHVVLFSSLSNNRYSPNVKQQQVRS